MQMCPQKMVAIYVKQFSLCTKKTPMILKIAISVLKLQKTILTNGKILY